MADCDRLERVSLSALSIVDVGQNDASTFPEILTSSARHVARALTGTFDVDGGDLFRGVAVATPVAAAAAAPPPEPPRDGRGGGGRAPDDGDDGRGGGGREPFGLGGGGLAPCLSPGLGGGGRPAPLGRAGGGRAVRCKISLTFGMLFDFLMQPFDKHRADSTF